MAIHCFGILQINGSAVMDDGEEWVEQARCKDEDIHLFFILRGDPLQRSKRQAAYNICRSCPVQRECLDYAMVNHEVGIWGGTSDNDRRMLRRTHAYTTKVKPRKRILWYNPHV